MSVLQVRGLSRSFGGLKAVDDVSFDLKKGEFLALIGPNGAGKTTLFNMLGGDLRPDTGSVRLHDRELVGKPPRRIVKMGVGRTFQITRLFLSMTVRENVQMALIARAGGMMNLMRRAAHQHVDRAQGLLDMVGMGAQAERPCSELAYGDLKRLELAMALAHEPALLLMDEPTAGMAPGERQELMELVAGVVRDQAVSVLFTEHDMDVVFAHAHRVLVLNRGALIAEGSGAEIRENAMVQEVYLGGGTVFAEGGADA